MCYKVKIGKEWQTLKIYGNQAALMIVHGTTPNGNHLTLKEKGCQGSISLNDMSCVFR